MNIRCVGACLMAMAVSASAVAGDLNPPAGPVAETGRFGPRTEINAVNTPGDADSLFKITQPGSYYLGGNVTGVANKHGIEIASDNVTIDLEGFALLGVANSFTGIRTDAPRSNITIRNGVATGWGRSGVNLTNFGAGTNALIERIHASFNVAIGIEGPRNSVIRLCTVESNSAGINAFDGSVVEMCVATLNTTSGISTSSGVVVRACQATNNGVDGIVGGNDCTVTDCSSRNNGRIGIFFTNGSTISNCSAGGNTLDGIHAANATVINCTASYNIGDGIEAESDCLIRNNACHSNGLNGDGAGIHVIGNDNRIEGNRVSDNDRNIDVDASGNLIIRNSSSGVGVAYDIVANNKVGVIVFAPNSPAILGSTGGIGVGTTDPWANFTY